MGVEPLRLTFNALGLVSEEVYNLQAEANVAAGYQHAKKSPPHNRPLAVVGGGPSVKAHLYELCTWPGDIWGINQMAQWLMQYEPKAPVTMFTVDPDPILANWTEGVESALLGSSVHPSVFAKFRKDKVRLFHTRQVKNVPDPDPPPGMTLPKISLQGPASVCRTFLPAALMGYVDITYFGCEGSIDPKTLAHNASRNDYQTGHRPIDAPRLLIIKAGGVEYVTTPDYYITTQFLANVLTTYKKLKEKSGGLLRAMLEYPDTWEVVGISTGMKDRIGAKAEEWQPYEPSLDITKGALVGEI